MWIYIYIYICIYIYIISNIKYIKNISKILKTGNTFLDTEAYIKNNNYTQKYTEESRSSNTPQYQL